MTQNRKFQVLAYLLLSLPIFMIITAMNAEPRVITASAALPQSVESEITSLQSRINNLTESANRWNDRYVLSLAIAVIVGVWTLVCQYSAIQRSRLVSDKQSELLHLKDLKAAADSQEKDKQIGEANKLAGEAKERAEKLEGSNLILKTAQQKVEVELSHQKELTAKAELQLAQLRDKIKWRSISPEQKQHIADRLAHEPKGLIHIFCVSGDAEGNEFARQINEVLLKSGFTTELGMSAYVGGNPVGLGIIVRSSATAPPFAKAVQRAFFLAGVPLAGVENHEFAPDRVVIMVGIKP